MPETEKSVSVLMNHEKIAGIYNRIDDIMSRKWWKIIAVIVFIIYPFRHISGGLDLWDTGYSCANFMNFGPEHMDKMWFFSTFLANAVGHLLTQLPYGHTLIGLNAYSAVFIVIMALVAFIFLTRKNIVPAGFVFIGEFVALNLLCFPAIVLYNTLTYMLFLLCVICLFEGFVEDKKLCFVIAGMCLGLNVFVRFSNLPQIAVYIAGLMIFFNKEDVRSVKDKWLYLFKRLGLYLIGYVAAVLLILLFIEVKYGIGEYADGIKRVFEISENAENYSIFSMILALIGGYVEGVRRLFYIAAAVVISSLCFKLIDSKKQDIKQSKKIIVVKLLILCVITLGMLGIMTLRGFYKINFYHYATMYYPTMAYITAEAIIAICVVVLKTGDFKLRLLGVMIALQMCIACVGSNTGMASGMNSMYMLSPFVMYAGYLLLKKVFLSPDINYVHIPAVFIISVVIMIFIMQSVLFGATYVFQEGNSGRHASVSINDNAQLIGIKAQTDRAAEVQGVSDFVMANDLGGTEALFYGNIPAMSFYLNMPAVFNPWPDLDSYGIKYMTEKMNELSDKIDGNGCDYPVVITDKTQLNELSGARADKWMLISSFIDKYEYSSVYSNDRFEVWARE